MKAKGFTLIEILVCISIIVLLSAILNPVFKSSLAAAKETHSKGNLRQQHLALKLYQAEWGGDGVHGTADDMAYPLEDAPTISGMWPTTLNVPETIWKSACCCHPDYPYMVIQYLLLRPKTRDEGQVYGDNMVTFIDQHCNSPQTKLRNIHEPRKALGILLSGTLVVRRKEGSFEKPSWWIED